MFRVYFFLFFFCFVDGVLGFVVLANGFGCIIELVLLGIVGREGLFGDEGF